MQLLCVIPARLGSTRLPQKPLCLLDGEPLVCRVAQRALELGVADRVVVAADHVKVLDAVSRLGVDAVLTDPGLASGTERVAAVAGMPQYRDFSVVLNIQGDEPFVSSEAVLGVLERVERGDAVGTAGSPLSSRVLMNAHRVKVVVDGAGRALRFSRVLPGSFAWKCDVSVLHHIGIYAYKPFVLRQWFRWRPAPDEAEVGLEQLRLLYNGVTVGVARVGHVAPPAIDTDRDLEMAEEYINTMTQRVAQ